MATHSSSRGRATRLPGRRSERDVLDLLIDAVRAGEGRVLVVAAEPGVGKTVLLDRNLRCSIAENDCFPVKEMP
jgi:hypothetical protein